jgi:hypothetical protein
MKIKFLLGSLALLILAFFIPEIGGMHLLADVLEPALGSVLAAGVCIPVVSIPEVCGPNPGGQNKLYVIRAVDLTSIPDPAVEGDVVVTADIVAKATRAFAHWAFAQDTGDLQVKAVGEDGNQSWEVSVSVFVPGDNALIAKVSNNVLNQKFVVIVVDGLGQARIGGTIDRGMVCTPEYNSGKAFTEKKGRTFTFKCGMAHEPFFYEGAIPVVTA